MSSIVPKLYRSVIDDVINSVRDVFLDDGIDEQILAELKQTWERKVIETKAIDQSDAPTSSNVTTLDQSSANNFNKNNSNNNGNNTANSSSQPNTSSTIDASNNVNKKIVQVDGPNTSDEDDDDDDFADEDDGPEDNEDDANDEDADYQGEEEEPLNSEDDVSDEDPTELFDTDNVVVCQYDKITRSRNKWKFHLKDGIMNLQGKDYVFQKAIGDAEW